MSGRKRMKKQPHPPKSNRYCQSCERITVWKYNPRVLHSECIICGGRFSVDPDKMEIQNER